MHITSADDLFQTQLQKLHSMETQILKAMPEMLENVVSEDLKKALQDHFEETKIQAKRLEDMGSEIDISFDATQDRGIKGILEEGKNDLEEVENPQLKDTVIISGSEKVEHYEMASYESAIDLAKQMGMDEVADTLEQTYNEEKKSADLLKSMAKGGISEFAERVKAVL